MIARALMKTATHESIKTVEDILSTYKKLATTKDDSMILSCHVRVSE